MLAVQMYICTLAHFGRRTVCLALHRFAQNSQLLRSLSWRSAVQNFTEEGKEMWKVLVEILFTAFSKGSLSLHQVASNPQAECRLAETAAVLKTLCCSCPCANINQCVT